MATGLRIHCARHTFDVEMNQAESDDDEGCGREGTGVEHAGGRATKGGGSVV